MAKTVRRRKSVRRGAIVSLTMFRALEWELLQIRETIESVRHESSVNLRRCGVLQVEVDALKKAQAGSVRSYARLIGIPQQKLAR